MHVKHNYFTLLYKALSNLLNFMENKEKQLEVLTGIRALMERSSKFVSFSGMSLISAGIIAIVGSVFVSLYLNLGFFEQDLSIIQTGVRTNANSEIITYLIITALIIFAFSLVAALHFSSKKARRQDIIFWDNMAKRVFLNLFIFLFTGGIFCIIIIYYGIYFLIVPSMLIFYGLALVNVSKFTMNEIAQLGIFEILLGIVASIIIVYPLLMWLIGFGVLHLIYGGYVYLKYERVKNSLQ